MQQVTVSSPSKLHLSGEHAVVYGKPAVLVATNKRLSVTIKKIATSTTSSGLAMIDNTQLSLRTRRVKQSSSIIQQYNNSTIEQFRKSDKYIDHICKIFEQKHKLKIENCKLKILSGIPIGKGMGSSASLAVALIGALSQFYKIPWNLSQINELAYKAEKFIHVNASGGDTSVSCMGGMLWFRREFEFLKTFWALPLQFPKNWSDFVLIDTGRSESTGELVSFVLEQKNKHLKKYADLFNQVEKVTKQMVLSIKLNNEKLFMQTISQNQMLLEKIGIVSKNVKKLVRLIEHTGGVAKISGAGGISTGSGIVIGYHQKPDIVKQIAKEFGYNTFQVKLAGEGVKIEKQIV